MEMIYSIGLTVIRKLLDSFFLSSIGMKGGKLEMYFSVFTDEVREVFHTVSQGF